MSEITVIVINWNGKHFLETCLSALQGQTFRDFETILVDNGSEDGSVEFVLENFPEIRLIALERNIGFAAGNLAGYQQSRGDWVVLLNNDTEADANWLFAVHEAAAAFPEAGMLASKMLYFDERNKIDNCGFDLTTAGATLDLGRDEKDSEQWKKTFPVFGACGGAVAYRRRMLEDIGFLDPTFFMTYEDADLSFRAQMRGYECMFVPGAVVYHRYRATMRTEPARQVYYSQRNIEFLYLKNMPAGLMLRYLPQRILYEVGAGFYFIRMGAGMPFLKAKWDALRQLPRILKKRKQIQMRRTVSDAKLRAMMRTNCLESKWDKFISAWRKPAAVNAPGPQAMNK